MLCSRCVLSDKFPGITFDAAGLCSLCQDEPPAAEALARRRALKGKVEELYRTVRGKDYDCLVAYSGGKDSSYTLWALSQTYGLRCLAITIDNGFVSKQAQRNIDALTNGLGVDHVYFKPAFAFMKTMYRESLEGGVHVGAAVKRASAVCNSCIGLINNHMIKTALQMEIPMIAGGYLGGQVPKDAAIFEFKLGAMERAREVTLKRYVQRFGEVDARRFFSLDGVPESARRDDIIYVTNPMLVLEVSEREVLERLAPFGWVRPTDTGRHSSNCRLNDLGIHMHLKQHGFHPYVAELAEQVRIGLMDRAEALERLEAVPDRAVLDPIAGELGLDLDAAERR
jgi:tRNA(Ile)-lysidine synthase TilS/MesJ